MDFMTILPSQAHDELACSGNLAEASFIASRATDSARLPFHK
jgi:hypothetical protein